MNDRFEKCCFYQLLLFDAKYCKFTSFSFKFEVFFFFSSQKVVRFWPHWLHLPLNRRPRQVSSSPLASPLPVHSLFCSCSIFHHKFGICSTFKSFYMGIITNKLGDCLLAYHLFSHKQWNLSYLNPLGPRVVHMFESWGWRDFSLLWPLFCYTLSVSKSSHYV